MLGQDGNGLLSPDGKYLAIMRPPGACVIDIARKQQVGEIRGGGPALFSPDSRRLMDTNQNVWDILPGGIIQRLSGAGECVFASGGKHIASIDNESGTVRVKFRHLDTSEEFSSAGGLPQAGFGIFQAIGDDGDLVCLIEARADDNRTKIREILAWLGFKQKPGLSFHWQLIDSRSGALVRQGNDALLAVSSDGRYVVSSDPRSAHVKLYELPERRSLLFIAIASGIWSAVAFIVPRWWRRRQLAWESGDPATSLDPGNALEKATGAVPRPPSVGLTT
jgi:hypothetical protein